MAFSSFILLCQGEFLLMFGAVIIVLVCWGELTRLSEE